MGCRSGCLTQDHRTWGECARAANIRVGQVDATEQRSWDRELDAYRQARAEGIQPASTRLPDVQRAMEASDATGRPFNAASPFGGLEGALA